MSESVRLELIKLIHRADKHPDEIIRDARIYEKYIVGKDDVKEELKNPDKQKGLLNPDKKR